MQQGREDMGHLIKSNIMEYFGNNFNEIGRVKATTHAATSSESWRRSLATSLNLSHKLVEAAGVEPVSAQCWRGFTVF
jgi:hypothetical protein